jgi:hypothetical protein
VVWSVVFSAWLALTVHAVALTAAAQPTPGPADATSSLSWVRLPGAEDCVGSHELANAVEARLRRDVFVSTADADVAVEGRIERHDDTGFRAVVAMSSRDGTLLGERVLDHAGTDCGSFTEVLALVIAVLLDPDATAPPEPNPAPPAHEIGALPPEAPAPEPAPRPAEPPTSTTPEERWRVELGAGVGASLGLLPHVAATGVGTVLIDPPGWFDVEIEGALVPYATTTNTSGDLVMWMAAGGLSACAELVRFERLRGHLCAGVQTGVLRVIPAGAEAREIVLVHGLARARIAVPLVWRLSAWLRTTLIVPIRRGGFTEGTEPAAAAGALDLGLAIGL